MDKLSRPGFLAIHHDPLFNRHCLSFPLQVKYAGDLGIPSSKGSWLVGFLSIMSTVGRVIFGKICEMQCVNKLYVFQFSVFAMGLSTVICPITEGYVGLLVYSVVFGFFDGCFVGQVVVIAGDIAGRRRLSQAVGNMFGVGAIPMSLGAPVAGRFRLILPPRTCLTQQPEFVSSFASFFKFFSPSEVYKINSFDISNLSARKQTN